MVPLQAVGLDCGPSTNSCASEYRVGGMNRCRSMVKIENKRGEGNERNMGTSLMVQFLRLHAAKTGGLGLIPGQGTRSHMLQLKFSHATAKKNPTCFTKIKDPTCCNEDPVQPNK